MTLNVIPNPLESDIVKKSATKLKKKNESRMLRFNMYIGSEIKRKRVSQKGKAAKDEHSKRREGNFRN